MMTIQIALASALLAPAQADPTGPTSAPRAVSPRPVDEQIEVMRALLIRRLGRSGIAQPLAAFGESGNFYQQQFNAYTGGFGGGNRAVGMSFEPTVEGAYLDGYGAVFTVALPTVARDPRAGEGAPKETPALSEWDREQRRLLGEPVPDKPTAPKTPSVSETLLKLLAENGKHFTALKDDERVTVAVTFRGPPTDRPPQAFTSQKDNTSGGSSLLSGLTTIGSATSSGNRIFNVNDLTGTVQNAADGHDQELLADLHLKQGQPQQAIDVLHKAIKQAELDVAQAGDDAAQAPRAASLANLYAKLANAQLAAGKEDEARTSLDRAKATRKKPANPPAKAASRLPARLTVSAPKKLLDQVGSGKITADEFRKQATVEYTAAARAESNKP